MLPEEGLAALAAQHPARSGRLPGLGVRELRVQAQQRGQVIRLVGSLPAQRAPEARHPVGGLAPQHPVRADVEGGERIQLEEEELGVLGRPRRLRQA